MIKTIELDCGIKFSLWSDFDKVPTNGIYLTLEVRDRDEVLKVIRSILNGKKAELVSLLLNEGGRKDVESMIKKYFELKDTYIS